jgi:hypothetical protein
MGAKSKWGFMKYLNLILIFCFYLPFGISAKEVYCFGGAHIEEEVFEIAKELDSDGSASITKTINLSDSSGSEFNLHVLVVDYSLISIELGELKKDFSFTVSSYGPNTTVLSLFGNLKNERFVVTCQIGDSGEKELRGSFQHKFD